VAHETRNAEPTQQERHAHGSGRYWIVWIALCCFTALTVWTGRMDLGNVNIFLALAIATIKATLVVLFFMHMTEAPGANRLVFSVSLVFTLVMMAGVFGDLLTRNPMSLPTGSVPSEIHAVETQAPSPR
jgi:cytochrome c oxidase subunit 4